MSRAFRPSSKDSIASTTSKRENKQPADQQRVVSDNSNANQQRNTSTNKIGKVSTTTRIPVGNFSKNNRPVSVDNDGTKDPGSSNPEKVSSKQSRLPVGKNAAGRPDTVDATNLTSNEQRLQRESGMDSGQENAKKPLHKTTINLSQERPIANGAEGSYTQQFRESLRRRASQQECSTKKPTDVARTK